MDISTLPFNRSLGIVADGASVRLIPTRDHLNHAETIHATVLFGVAEAAAGQWLIARFPTLENVYNALLRGSSVKYRRPAFFGADICGVGNASHEAVEKLESNLKSRGCGTIEIDVAVTQEGMELLSGAFCWFVARK